ncbi:HD domain-containing phosphohydrolase [Geobacter benzoatilyticus]|uniref:DUF3365 domain-containing protein n=1 Tax=Geobacter benzoatilyticus TaxID=2815309 RepID=A0ABX7Q5U8_9BACT|nr:HD domain-containing phosphohydrolase [Geobacter benzoatilyticus]QSV46739.1 DUF3365 domain-containing protein [Geobacter benzoatilyticus]
MAFRMALTRKFLTTVGTTVLVTLGILFFFMYEQSKEAIYNLVDRQSTALLQQVLITRAWISEHEGIYLRQSPGMEPNPYLPGSGITDKEGRKYVFHNPALAIRKLSEYADRQGLYRFHLASLRPLNPANTPTPFEAQALRQFELSGYNASKRGIAGIVQEGSNSAYQRVIPLVVEKSCLVCHLRQGYRLGDIRGSLSVTIPLHEAERQIGKARILYASAAFGIMAVVMGTLYLLLRRMVLKPVAHLHTVASKLSAGNYNARAALATGDELENLGAAFNSMTDQIINGYQSGLKTLAAAVEARDSYTRGHIDRVARYALGIAREMGLAPEIITKVEIAAILHDIGKIGIPDAILRKEGPLSPEEFGIMQAHSLKGMEIISTSSFFSSVMDAILHHHEFYDGSGYPGGLRGEEIPLVARIITVADSFDAMTTDRPYRRGLDWKTALEEIVAAKGSQFDPLVVDAFVQGMKKGNFVVRGETDASRRTGDVEPAAQ